MTYEGSAGHNGDSSSWEHVIAFLIVGTNGGGGGVVDQSWEIMVDLMTGRTTKCGERGYVARSYVTGTITVLLTVTYCLILSGGLVPNVLLDSFIMLCCSACRRES